MLHDMYLGVTYMWSDECICRHQGYNMLGVGLRIHYVLFWYMLYLWDNLVVCMTTGAFLFILVIMSRLLKLYLDMIIRLHVVAVVILVHTHTFLHGYIFSMCIIHAYILFICIYSRIWFYYMDWDYDTWVVRAIEIIIAHELSVQLIFLWQDSLCNAVIMILILLWNDDLCRAVIMIWILLWHDDFCHTVIVILIYLYHNGFLY